MDEDKPILDLDKLPEKQAAFALLRANGLEIKKAGSAVNYTENTAYKVNSKLNKYRFTGDHKSQRIAHTTIKSLAQGKVPKGSNIKEIKDNTSFQAAKYISDHNDPVVMHVKTQNEHIVAVMTPESLDKYK